VRAADLRAAASPAQPVLEKVGRSVTTAARGTIVRSGVAAGGALVALSAVSAVASAIRRRTAAR
jgi:hypothetical protein